jgi:putative transport protein
MEKLAHILQEYPELAVFLTLTLGFIFGHIKINTFKIGVVLGTLLVGGGIGQLDITVPSILKVIFFDLFLFAIVFEVGPKSFQRLKKNAFPQLILTLVICVSCLYMSFGTSKVLNYDTGTTAGLLAGAFSESILIGTAAKAINKLPGEYIEMSRFINNIPVFYQIGIISFVFFFNYNRSKIIEDKIIGIKRITLSISDWQNRTGTRVQLWFQ